MMPVFIYCPRCRKNLLAAMPDGQVWQFEEGEHRCEDCKITLKIEPIYNELRWSEEPNPEFN